MSNAENCIATIPLPEFHERITTSDVIMIDVREPHEVEVVRVNANNYVNVPLRVFEDALKMEPSLFKETYHVEKPSKTDDILLICRSGNRSGKAVTLAQNLQFLNTCHYKGGTNEYTTAYPNEVIKEKQ